MRWTRAERDAEATYLDKQAALNTEASADAAQHAVTTTDPRTRASCEYLTRHHAENATDQRAVAAALRDGVHPSELGYQ